jgi:nucleotide-binding universal stress UspA family protein
MSYRIVGRVDGSPQSIEALLWALDEAVVRPESELRVVLAWQLPFLSNPAAFDRDELQLTYEEFLIKTVSEIVPVPQFPLETLSFGRADAGRGLSGMCGTRGLPSRCGEKAWFGTGYRC